MSVTSSTSAHCISRGARNRNAQPTERPLTRRAPEADGDLEDDFAIVSRPRSEGDEATSTGGFDRVRRQIRHDLQEIAPVSEEVSPLRCLEQRGLEEIEREDAHAIARCRLGSRNLEVPA